MTAREFNSTNLYKKPLNDTITPKKNINSHIQGEIKQTILKTTYKDIARGVL